MSLGSGERSLVESEGNLSQWLERSRRCYHSHVHASCSDMHVLNLVRARRRLGRYAAKLHQEFGMVCKTGQRRDMRHWPGQCVCVCVCVPTCRVNAGESAGFSGTGRRRPHQPFQNDQAREVSIAAAAHFSRHKLTMRACRQGIPAADQRKLIRLAVELRESLKLAHCGTHVSI